MKRKQKAAMMNDESAGMNGRSDLAGDVPMNGESNKENGKVEIL